jgi:hypothetical protein
VSIADNADLATLAKTILNGMTDYMAEYTATYTASDVEACGKILDEHISALQSANSKDEALAAVKSTVMKLNTLNSNCDSELIETDQRESICEYLIKAGALLGFNEEGEDITEEWRDW